MPSRSHVPPRAIARALARARELTAELCDVATTPGERLHEIGRQLGVSQIEPGAVRTDGFLKRLPDGTFAVYYADDCGLERRRFTVAHELGHLVLERYHKHLSHDGDPAAGRSHGRDIEAAVNRIAAELLMPEPLVVGLLTAECRARRHQARIVPKHSVIEAVGRTLGVSESSLVYRLLELRPLLAVHWRVQWRRDAGPERARFAPGACSRHSYVRLVDGSYPEPAALAREPGWEHRARLETQWGVRAIYCHGWPRPALPGQVEVWIVGWTWNLSAVPAWDDSDPEGKPRYTVRMREFKSKPGKPRSMRGLRFH